MTLFSIIMTALLFKDTALLLREKSLESDRTFQPGYFNRFWLLYPDRWVLPALVSRDRARPLPGTPPASG